MAARRGVRPRPAVAARLHRLREVQPALERAGEQRREQPRMAAHACDRDAAPAQRLDEAGRVPLERRHEPGRQRHREHRAPREAAPPHQAIMVEPSAYAENANADPAAAGIESAPSDLLRRDVERAHDGDRRPGSRDGAVAIDATNGDTTKTASPETSAPAR